MAAPVPRRTRLRGRTPLRVGAVLLVVGVLALIVGVVVVATKSVAKVNDFQRVAVADGTGTVSFATTGGYVAYYEAEDVSTDTTEVPLVGVTLLSPSGRRILVNTPYGGRSDNKIKALTYPYRGHSGVALYQFTITETGRYRVVLQPNSLDGPGATIAFGKSIATGTVVGALLVIVGVLLLLAGLVVLIVGLVKRGRHKKQLAAGMYRGGTRWQGGWPQGQGGQGYSAQ